MALLFEEEEDQSGVDERNNKAKTFWNPKRYIPPVS